MMLGIHRSGRGRRVSAVSILVGIVMLLVPALAWMQYQWLGQLSEAVQQTVETQRQSNLAIDQLNDTAKSLKTGIEGINI